MSKGTTTLEFMIGLLIGIAILFALLYPLVSFTSLYFGSSINCIGDQSTSSLDGMINNIEGLKDGDASSQIINLEKKECALVFFDKDNIAITPPQDLFKKTAICICEFENNACTDKKYCKELTNINSINVNGFSGKRFVQITNRNIVDIYYKKEGKVLTILDNEIIPKSNITPIITKSGPLGIDVSKYQGNIDWAQVHNAGYSFAFVKATEGISIKDSYFIKNMNNGKANGVLMGAYHFARPNINSAIEEAKHFVSVAGPYIKSGYLNPVLDIETDCNLGKSELSKWINTWMDSVKSQTGIEPILYMNSNYANNCVDSSVIKRNLWIAMYTSNSAPNTGIWNGKWNFWQYTSKGSVPGISGNVDINKFNEITPMLTPIS